MGLGKHYNGNNHDSKHLPHFTMVYECQYPICMYFPSVLKYFISASLRPKIQIAIHDHRPH